ncbi:putative lipoprotein YerH [Halobacillus andaensis]|uniref:Lipoprotein YerH n=1 Tax=Halobacillus andaensis TaxID=1176239 RepID=A0A917B9D1_HALAA|nr:CamS family sex pheromone protein [Halobacillus andaensis]MBP2005752.1 protein involved in sex pheromone biosynthesis [Halobacillus andaensis]GGF26273.1 putative lipoprotein YerH [Halobacillus andaensis]
MRKLHAVWLAMILIVSACTPVYDNTDEVVRETTDEDSDEKAIIPNYDLSDDSYRMILTEGESKISAARGVTTNQMGNRLDIAEFEGGLQRHSKEYFSTEDYYFQPGQFLDESTLLSWLGRYEEPEDPDNPEETGNVYGLNPELDEDSASEEDFRENPRYISNIVEQDYLVRQDDDVVEVAGLTIGISMRSIYDFQAEGREYSENISTSESLSRGQEYADKILERLREREELQDVPVMFAIYEEEEDNAESPGNFLSKGYAEGSDNTVGGWADIDEEYVLFPSDEAEEEHFDDAEVFSDFRSEVSDYFPNFVGMIANGFYVDDELHEVKIDIPIQFDSHTEVTGFTQYVYSLVMEMFEDHYAVEVKINSMDQQESLIVKKPGQEEPFVHIYE